MMLLDGPNLYVIPKRALQELKPPKTITSFQMRTPISPKAKPLAFPHDWLKISQLPQYNYRWKNAHEIKSNQILGEPPTRVLFRP
jgi:hypothetical protein